MPRQEEGALRNHTLQDFAGVNTQAKRQAIKDEEFAWLENVMPIGHGNMLVTPGASASLATWSGTAYFFDSYNIAGVEYQGVICTNGAAYQVNLNTYAVTTIASAGTFSAAGASFTQWKNERILIIDPSNGYFDWNGTTLTKWTGSIQSVTVLLTGTQYTSRPSVGVSGGGGTGLTVTVDLEAVLVSLNTAGTNYLVGDILTASGGTLGSTGIAFSITVTSISGGGVSGPVTGFNISTPGDYTAPPATPVSFTGSQSGGSGFKANVNYGLTNPVVTNAGAGYTSNPTLTVTGGGATVQGTLQANLSVVPGFGTAIAVYASRVWVVTGSGRTIQYSAPGSYSDFTSADSGGSFIVSDSTLRSTVQGLLAANNFLYILGISSINVIADVTVVNGIAMFSNTNLDASTGTAFPKTLTPYFRSIWFATKYGIYALYGSTAQKASDALDGIWPLVNLSNSITAGTVIIYEILCLAFLFTFNDPVAGTRQLMAVYFNKKWYFASVTPSIKLMATAYPSGVESMFATDGSNLYQLFTNTSSTVYHKVQSKLFQFETPILDKQSMKFGLEIEDPILLPTFTLAIDTEQGSVNYALANTNLIQWQNASGNTVQWVNASNNTVGWIGESGYDFYKLDISTNGAKYLGSTLSGYVYPGTTYIGMHWQYIDRAPW